MSDHTYQPGDLVERISTGERAQYAHGPIFDNPPQLICSVSSVAERGCAPVFWPAHDCRPAVDHSAELAAKDAEIAKLRKLCGEAAQHIGCGGDACCKCNEHDMCQRELHQVTELVLHKQLRAAAEGE